MVCKWVSGSGALHRVVRGRGALGVSWLLHTKQERDESWEEAKKTEPPSPQVRVQIVPAAAGRYSFEKMGDRQG